MRVRAPVGGRGLLIFIFAFPLSDPIQAMIPSPLLGADPLHPPQGLGLSLQEDRFFPTCAIAGEVADGEVLGSIWDGKIRPASDLMIRIEDDLAPKEG